LRAFYAFFIVIAALALVSIFGAAPALAQNAYIPNLNSDNVSVINLATHTVIATIPVGSHPQGVAVTPDQV
jgi:YVTN family beta-propeller protein